MTPIPRLHIVTNDTILDRRDFTTLAMTISNEVDATIHLRARELAGARLFQLAETLKPHCRLAINDRLDIALAAGIDTVHVGARGLPLSAIRAVAPDVRVGYSAHSAEEAAQAERDGAVYIFAGTIFPSASHPEGPAGGLDLLERICDATSVPVLAIGGVTVDRVEEIRKAGAYGVAVISAVWHAPDPVHAAREFARILEL